MNSLGAVVPMNRNYKAWFEKELNCTLMDREEQAFWDAVNPSASKEQVERASERLYDLLRERGVRVRD